MNQKTGRQPSPVALTAKAFDDAVDAYGHVRVEAEEEIIHLIANGCRPPWSLDPDNTVTNRAFDSLMSIAVGHGFETLGDFTREYRWLLQERYPAWRRTWDAGCALGDYNEFEDAHRKDLGLLDDDVESSPKLLELRNQIWKPGTTRESAERHIEETNNRLQEELRRRKLEESLVKTEQMKTVPRRLIEPSACEEEGPDPLS